MRTMVVTCENGDRFGCEVEPGDTLRITKAGNVRLIQHDGPSSTVRMDSPAVSIHELVEHDPDA